MMNQAAASPWIDSENIRSGSFAALALALVAGLLLGSALTTLASESPAPAAPAAAEREWRHPALDREWRGIATPVDVDRMFRTRH